MIEKWCDYEIQLMTWGLSSSQYECIHYMKYEIICPNMFEKEAETLVCRWDLSSFFVLIRMMEEKVQVFRGSESILCPYKSIYLEGEVKEFVPEIYRFV